MLFILIMLFNVPLKATFRGTLNRRDSITSGETGNGNRFPFVVLLWGIDSKGCCHFPHVAEHAAATLMNLLSNALRMGRGLRISIQAL